MIFDLIGGFLESGASKKAAKIQAAAADRGIAEMRRQYNTTRADQAPWMQSGTNALRRLDALLGIDPGAAGGELLTDFSLADFEADPGYQVRMGEGSRAIENSAAARGMQLSGANLKALNRFSQDFASNEFNNAYNRDALNKQRKFNFLSNQSGMGQATAAQLGQMGQNTAGNVADMTLQQGNARAAGRVGAANAWGNAFRNINDRMTLERLR